MKTLLNVYASRTVPSVPEAPRGPLKVRGFPRPSGGEPPLFFIKKPHVFYFGRTQTAHKDPISFRLLKTQFKFRKCNPPQPRPPLQARSLS